MLFQLRHSAEHVIAGLDDLMIAAERLVEALQYGAHTRRKSGSGENFWQFRDYEAGSDRPQDIDWRQSAKGTHVYVREKELQTAQDNVFWVDKNDGMNFRSTKSGDTKLSRAQILSMALALLLARGGEKISLAGTDIRGHSEGVLENFGLHLLQDKAVQDFDIRAKSNLFMLGDFITPIEEIEPRLTALAERSGECFLIQILDTAELNLPYSGRVIFEAGQSAPIPDTEIQNVSSIRSTYQERLQEHLQAVEDLCRKHGWFYMLHRTDEDARDLLLRIMQEVSA